MPYRRLPKTDAARLKALKAVLENDDIYTVRNRFIDWKTLNQAQPVYDKLLTACEQYKVNLRAQTRNSAKMNKLHRNALIYVSHFLQVLFMSVERGEIKRQTLKLYGLDTPQLPNLKTADGLLAWGQRAIDGEKERVKQGGRPIYNPTISMVATHYDIFKEMHERQQALMRRTKASAATIAALRPTADELILALWNQIESHYASLPPDTRFEECSKLGVVYYYRKGESQITPHLPSFQTEESNGRDN